MTLLISNQLMAAFFLVTFSLISLSVGKKTKDKYAFALYAGLIALIELTLALFRVPSFVEYHSILIRLITVIYILSLLTVLYYSVLLTKINNLISKNQKQLFFILFFSIALIVLILSSNLIISPDNIENSNYDKQIIGPLYFLMPICVSFFTIYIPIILVKAYKFTNSLKLKIRLKYNLVAISIILVWTSIFSLTPYGNLSIIEYSTIPLPIATIIFYLSIIRYQFAEISEINADLENRIQDKTNQLKQVQAKLALTEKIAGIVELVAGLVHQVNTPLGAMISNNNTINKITQKLIKELKSINEVEFQNRSEIKKLLRILDELTKQNELSGHRVDETLKGLVHFARLDEAIVKKVDLNKSIDITLLFMEHQFRNRIRIIKEYNQLPHIQCKPRQINQVFMNIFFNAIQAIKGKGEIYISTKQKDKYVWIKIRDNGIGISPESLTKIFLPGYTTKQERFRTGLGLAICKLIIQGHGGKIRVISVLGEGTTFTIILPITLKNNFVIKEKQITDYDII